MNSEENVNPIEEDVDKLTENHESENIDDDNDITTNDSFPDNIEDSILKEDSPESSSKSKMIQKLHEDGSQEDNFW